MNNLDSIILENLKSRLDKLHKIEDIYKRGGTSLIEINKEEDAIIDRLSHINNQNKRTHI